MNLSRSAAVLAVATLAAALLGWLCRDRLGTPQRPHDTRSSEPIAEGKSAAMPRREPPLNVITTHAVASLAQRVESLEKRRAEPAAQPGATDALSPDHAAAEAKRTEEFELIDQAFNEEPREPTWASQQTKALRQLFEQAEFPQTQLVGLDCRTTFCRMQVRHDSPAGTRSFEQIASRAPGNTYGHVIERDGVQETVVFFIRPGLENDHVVYHTLAAMNE